MNPVSPDIPIAQKIAWAKARFKEYGAILREDPGVRDLLDHLQAALEETRQAMEAAGLPEACRICEEEDGGSCCGAGIDKHYDGILLLINLLLDSDLPEKRRFPSDCFFLGNEGCRLKARQVLCVNYLCSEVVGAADTERINALREREGIELETTFRLHDRIKKVLKDEEA